MCYTCNKFGYVEKEWKNKTMNSYKQQVDSMQSKKPNKNVVIQRLEKYGSTSTTHTKQKKEEKVRCSLAWCVEMCN